MVHDSSTASIRRWRIPIQTLALAGLAACVEHEPEFGSEAYHAKKEMIFEACLPDRRLVYEIRPVDASAFGEPGVHDSPSDLAAIPSAPHSVYWVELGEGPGRFEPGDLLLEETTSRSDGSQPLMLWNRTISGQPVYHSSYGGDWRDEYLGVGLLLKVAGSPYRDGYVQYWFEVPPGVREGEFTPWRSAAWAGDPGSMTFWNLMHDRKIEKPPVPPNAPRLRFTRIAERDIEHQNQLVWLTRHAAGRQYLVDWKSRKDYAPVPIAGPPAPDC